MMFPGEYMFQLFKRLFHISSHCALYSAIHTIKVSINADILFRIKLDFKFVITLHYINRIVHLVFVGE